jgi:hypothetical protein
MNLGIDSASTAAPAGDTATGAAGMTADTTTAPATP